MFVRQRVLSHWVSRAFALAAACSSANGLTRLKRPGLPAVGHCRSRFVAVLPFQVAANVTLTQIVTGRYRWLPDR